VARNQHSLKVTPSGGKPGQTPALQQGPDLIPANRLYRHARLPCRAMRRFNKAALEHIIFAPTGFVLQYQAWRKNVAGLVKGPLPFFWGEQGGFSNNTRS
jgi:hypothetical protein